jgi:hypothetical protein
MTGPATSSTAGSRKCSASRRQAITLFWAQVTVVMTMAALAFSLVRFT